MIGPFYFTDFLGNEYKFSFDRRWIDIVRNKNFHSRVIQGKNILWSSYEDSIPLEARAYMDNVLQKLLKNKAFL